MFEYILAVRFGGIPNGRKMTKGMLNRVIPLVDRGFSPGSSVSGFRNEAIRRHGKESESARRSPTLLAVCLQSGRSLRLPSPLPLPLPPQLLITLGLFSFSRAESHAPSLTFAFFHSISNPFSQQQERRKHNFPQVFSSLVSAPGLLGPLTRVLPSQLSAQREFSTPLISPLSFVHRFSTSFQ